MAPRRVLAALAGLVCLGGAAYPAGAPDAEAGAETEKLMTELRQMATETLPAIHRLDDLKDGYRAQADLAAADAERNPLRKELLDKKGRIDEKVAALKATPDGRDPLKRSYFVEEMRNFDLKLRITLRQDEEEYDLRKREVELELANKRARDRAMAAGAGGLLLFCGAAAWYWRRRRASIPD